ncbi:MAG TPA: tetratricopeptide repeat protein, partial [Gemmataceae bacterium]|nr:tetratricopeptide repeat protein [Gemmataceae bacterium]
MSGSDAGPWLLPLLEARAGALEQLPAQIYESPELRPLVGWGHTGQALVAMRHGDYPRAHQHLDQALASGADGDPILRATCAHYRGAVYHHAGQPDAALVQLHDALELFSTEHFVAGRVLDTLGMVYAATDDYATARELYEAAIRCKERCQDKQGLAVSHGQLGRLALDWGDLREAERHFRMDLDLALRLEDERGVALMYGALGQVALSDGRAAEAAALLDESIRRAHLGGWTITEGYARKDRARACLLLHEREDAEHQLNTAEVLFQPAGFAEGLAHLYRVRAQLWQDLGKYDEAERLLMRALAHFESMRERVQVARTQRELAQLMRRRGASAVLVSQALLRGLESAERCRRHILVREIEAELRAVDEVAYMRHIYQRARGRGVRVDTASLLSGERETITVLFLDLESSTEYMRGTDPEVILLTLNQMMAKLADV